MPTCVHDLTGRLGCEKCEKAGNPRYQRVLWAVIAINGIMVFVGMIAGQLAGFQALKADALDFLANTVTYGLSLAVIGASIKTRSTAALFEGLSLSVMAVWLFSSTVYQTLVPGLPSAELMALSACCAGRQLGLPPVVDAVQDGDGNNRLVWLCSRNDAIGNAFFIFAALGVRGSQTAWPDLAVAGVMAFICMSSSAQIL